MDDDALHRGQSCRYMCCVWVRLKYILPLAIQRLKHTIYSSIKHIGNAQARLRIERHAPIIFKQTPSFAVADMTISGQFVREAAHVACALDIILATQRIYAHSAPPDIAGRHSKIGNCHDGRATLAMLGYAKPVIDRAVTASCIKPRRRPQFVGIDQRDRLQIFRAVACLRNKIGPMAIFVPVTAFFDEGFVS